MSRLSLSVFGSSWSDGSQSRDFTIRCVRGGSEQDLPDQRKSRSLGQLRGRLERPLNSGDVDDESEFSDPEGFFFGACIVNQKEPPGIHNFGGTS